MIVRRRFNSDRPEEIKVGVLKRVTQDNLVPRPHHIERIRSVDSKDALAILENSWQLTDGGICGVDVYVLLAATKILIYKAYHLLVVTLLRYGKSEFFLRSLLVGPSRAQVGDREQLQQAL